MKPERKNILKSLAVFIACFISLACLPVSAISEEIYRFGRMWPVLEQPWYFSSPSDLAADRDDFIYIADTKNDQIQKFSSDGQFVAKWGSKGDEKGQFLLPCGIEIDSSGFVYVADSGNNRIQKFTGDGKFLIITDLGEPCEYALTITENHRGGTENHRVI